MKTKYKKIENFVPLELELKNHQIIRKDTDGNKITTYSAKCASMAFACCDCNLVHDIIFIPKKDKLRVIMYRNNHKTSALRRNDAKTKKR